MIRLCIAMVTAALMSGCATQEKRLQSAADLCEKIGFQQGTDKFKECQHQAYQSDTTRRATASALTK